MNVPLPYALLAELTYSCPLHCPYCSNPVAYPQGTQLPTEDWLRVIREAAAIGVLQIGFSGGEPLLRADLGELISQAHLCGLYSNLLTSGIGLSAKRAAALKSAGLDAVQLSFQSDQAVPADLIAGGRAHTAKMKAAEAIAASGLAFGINVVLHRENINRVEQIVAFAVFLGAQRLELANAQYYGWAFLNRLQLLPTRVQVNSARVAAERAKAKYAGQLEIFYVLPDYYETRPKPCMQGWGRRYLTVNPIGEVLPCPNATCIRGLKFENVRDHSLREIWEFSESFNRFRGTAWMPEPCRHCAARLIDFGGCRCQAALLTGDSSGTDPVCEFAAEHQLVECLVEEVNAPQNGSPDWVPRCNPVLA